MKVFHHRDVEEEAEEGAVKTRVRRLITKETGAENFAMRLFTMEAGGSSPLHSHPWEHEVFVLEGRGLVRGEEGERAFGEGDVIFIPPNEIHQLRNTGDVDVRFICLIPYKHVESK
ncbi:MAG: cupin domain-containing protein [Candidatus Geothermarchaeales archaeon]